jgi:hypothetical protein
MHKLRGSNYRYLNLAGTRLPVKVRRGKWEVLSCQILTGNKICIPTVVNVI